MLHREHSGTLCASHLGADTDPIRVHKTGYPDPGLPRLQKLWISDSAEEYQKLKEGGEHAEDQ
jgi:hypothetical protein